MTVGVVVSLPAETAARVAREKRARKSPKAEIPAHITLVSLLPAHDRWAEIAAHLRETARRHEPFAVELDGAGTFLPVSPVAFLAVGEGRERLAALEADVRRGPLAVERPYPFVPHVTVLHPGEPEEVRRAERELSAFRERFRVASMGLYQKPPGESWVHREEIPLGQNPSSEQRSEVLPPAGEG